MTHLFSVWAGYFCYAFRLIERRKQKKYRRHYRRSRAYWFTAGLLTIIAMLIFRESREPMLDTPPISLYLTGLKRREDCRLHAKCTTFSPHQHRCHDTPRHAAAICRVRHIISPQRADAPLFTYQKLSMAARHYDEIKPSTLIFADASTPPRRLAYHLSRSCAAEK